MKSFFSFFFISLVFIFFAFLIPKQTFADECKGYAAGSSTLERGVCIYAGSDSSPYYSTIRGGNHCSLGQSCSLPTCTEIGQKLFNDSHYHGISDSIESCMPNLGAPVKCCAKDNAPPAAAPPPCNKDSQGNCTSVTTGLGSIPTNITSVISTIFGILLSFAGGITIIIIIISGYRIMVSQADPEKLKGAREMLTSAIVGLLFIIFSIAILQIIGVDILHIPGFVSGPTTAVGGGGHTFK